MTFCELGTTFTDLLADGLGSLTLYEVRNGAADPYVGPLAEGAGKLHVGRAIAALRDGVVVYSAASGSGADAGTGPRDLQGSWQVGAVAAGAIRQPAVRRARGARRGPDEDRVLLPARAIRPTAAARSRPAGALDGHAPRQRRPCAPGKRRVR